MEQQARHPSALPEGQFDSSSVTVTTDNSRGAPTRPAPPIVTLSEDPVLLEAISAAALDLVPVIVAPSPDRFIDQVVAAGGELALIDATSVPDDLASFLESVHRQFPQLQLLLAGPGNVQHQIGTQMTDGTIYRFVHKPASAQRLRLFVDAALRERQTRVTEEILRSPFPVVPAAAMRSARDPGRPWWATATVGAVLLIAAAGVVIWYSSQSEHRTAALTSTQSATSPPAASAPRPAPAPVVAPPTPAPVQTPPVSRLASPSGLTEAEQAAVDHAAAERSERSEKERLAAEADARLEAQIGQAKRAQNDARLAQVHQLVQQARSRIASGALIEPANDSARTYVSAAIEQAPDEQEVRAVSVALGDALVNSFRKALAAGDSAAADKWLEASRSYQISQPTLDQMAVQLEGFRAGQLAQSSAAKAVQNASTVDAVVTAPPSPVAVSTAPAATASGPTPVKASTEIVREGDLHRLEFNPPKYPPEALMRGQTGSVELDFTVTPAGTVTDIKVTKSNPIGVFEQAAIAALVRNRYEPIERDGVPVAQRAHIRMRFAL
jgi:TonB family protein